MYLQASSQFRDAHMEDKVTSPHQLSQREQEILERLASGLSDQQVADELFLSVNTIKWYNRQIYSKLGVGSRTQAIAAANQLGLLADDPSSILVLPAPRHNLPIPPTPFIGRSREIAQVKQLLNSSRLLTLTGTGGTGKTRLALRVAEDVIEDFTDGVYFIDLAPLSNHALVLTTLAGVFGVVENPSESLLNTLKRVLARRETLLLIDNFEHVIDAAPLLSELLASSSRLKILVTSRESLRLAGEQEYPVLPLSLPLMDKVSLQSLTQSEAGALFVQRAQMTQPHFEVSNDSALAIAKICTRLDGLPLAIELAAARCKLLTPQVLMEHLGKTDDDSPLHTLTSGSRGVPQRHRTLRDTMAWSYNLLDEGEKTLFARLAVFRGGRSLEAIKAVCGENLSIDIFDGLASLVDKSLVQQKESPNGDPRFYLLEMIHEYARERLEASGEAEVIRRRHAEYFVTLADRGEPELRLARYDYWCQLFELELDNIRAILEWTLGIGDVVLGVRLAAALGLFWYGKGHHVEGIRWTQQLLARLDEVPVEHHPKFLFSAGHMTWMYDLDTAKPLFMRALDISRNLGDKLHVAWALIMLAYTMQQEPETAMPIAEEGLALFRELNYQPGIAQALNIMGEIARISGDDERARHAYEECLAVCQQTGETRRICYMYTNLAYIAQHEGDHEHGLHLGRESLRLARDRMDRRDMADALIIIAGSMSALGQLQSAVELLGASETELEHMGAFLQPSDKPEYDRIIAELRAQLDEAAFHAAWAQGQAMTLEHAVTIALAGT
jgi:predicted ATPase/DNA-binding CsgD family transcriptional regulator